MPGRVASPGHRCVGGLLPREPPINLIVVTFADQLHVHDALMDTVDDSIFAGVRSQQVTAVELLVVLRVGVAGELDYLQKGLPGVFVRQVL